MSIRSLNKLFHDTCEKFDQKQCTLSVSKTSQTSISYNMMKKFIAEILDILKKCGVSGRKNQFIGITNDILSVEVIAIMIGIMDTNNAFVFLDTSSSQISKILHKLNISLIIGQRSFTENCQLFASFKLLETFELLEEHYGIFKRCDDTECFNPEYQFAFAVMSSGSTGEPKIIKVPHESIVPNIIDLKNIYEMKPEDVLYLITPPTFDPCIVDIFLTFYAGASILLPSDDLKFNDNFLFKTFSKSESSVTIWCTTPSLFTKCFSKEIEQSNLRILVLGGEQFPSLCYQTYPCLRDVKIFNIYGITEVSCWASIQAVEDLREVVPLGNTLSDTIFEIRSESDRKSDSCGELFIGSRLRKCAVNDDTSISSEDVLFRATGDLVKCIEGKYYFVGRKDRRIKLYGHIVDLSAIETIILKYNDVKRCCCIFIQNDNKIIALVESSNENLNVIELEKFLHDKLPSIMLPCCIFTVKIPINSHGKTCESSCHELYSKIKNQSDLPKEFQSLWKKYTNNYESIDFNSGFVHAGGNSVLALQFTTSLEDFCQVPKDFIAFLLSNKNYDECFKLIENESFKATKNHLNETSSITIKHIENEEPPFPKKLKFSTYNDVVQIKSKHFVENCNVSEEKIRQPSELKLNWKYNMDKCVDASPTLVVFENNAAAVICGSHSGQIVVLDVPSGDPKLKIRLPDRIESSVSVSSCGKFLFFGCYDKKLYCINIPKNTIQWYFKTEDIIKSTPVLFKNRLYFGSYDHNFYCISSESGSLFWKYDIDKASIYATPIVTEEYIIVATLGGTIAALDHCGIIKYSNFFGKPFFSNPLKLPTKEEFIVIDVTGVIRLIKAESGCQICSHHINGNIFSSIAITDYSINCKITFGCYDKNIYCFEILDDSFRLTWKKKLEANIYSTPFAFWNCETANNPCKYKYIAVTCISGSIHVLDSDTGNCLLNFSIFEPIFSSPVVHDSFMVVGCRDNFLYCFEIM